MYSKTNIFFVVYLTVILRQTYSVGHFTTHNARARVYKACCNSHFSRKTVASKLGGVMFIGRRMGGAKSCTFVFKKFVKYHHKMC